MFKKIKPWQVFNLIFAAVATGYGLGIATDYFSAKSSDARHAIEVRTRLKEDNNVLIRIYDTISRIDGYPDLSEKEYRLLLDNLGIRLSPELKINPSHVSCSIDRLYPYFDEGKISFFYRDSELGSTNRRALENFLTNFEESKNIRVQDSFKNKMS